MQAPSGFARRAVFGGLLFIGTGALALAVTLPDERARLLRLSGWALVAITSAALAAAVFTPRARLAVDDAPRAATTAVIVALANVAGAAGALGASQALLAVGGLIGAVAALTVAARLLLGS